MDVCTSIHKVDNLSLQMGEEPKTYLALKQHNRPFKPIISFLTKAMGEAPLYRSNKTLPHAVGNFHFWPYTPAALNKLEAFLDDWDIEVLSKESSDAANEPEEV